MQKLVENILADGKIDAKEVEELRKAIFEDGEVSKEEADALFELNEKATEKDPSFKDLFVEGIKSFILADGEVDKEEEDYLLNKISADGQVDECEKALLQALYAEAQLPESLVALMD